MKRIIPIIISLFFISSFSLIALPRLSSFPAARATIFLDFDGQFVQGSSWRSGNPFYCTPSGLNDVQITEVFNRVAEDFRPFNLNITTDSTVYLAAPLAQRMRIIVTLTSDWYAGVGGVSFTRSFTWGDETPAFVFPDRLGYSPKNVAECCSHESGHTLGLSHQAKYDNSCTLLATYNDGIGSGQIGWAPVMGNSYGRNLSGWNNGPTPIGCTADQDNLSIITSVNGFTYRPDDYADDAAANPATVVVSNNIFSQSGIISTNTDKDVFKFSFVSPGNFHIDAVPFSVSSVNDGADLDIKMTLLASDFSVIKVYDAADILNISLDTILNPGNYFVVIEGTANQNVSNYGSLGSYTISGSFVPNGALPIRQALLTGKINNSTHELSWNIISDDPVKNIIIEISEDGVHFKTLIPVDVKSLHYAYRPVSSNTLFYRIKVLSDRGEVAYSNVISLKSLYKTNNLQVISSVVSSEIKISTTSSYEYMLADMSGRVMKAGKGLAGESTININNSPNGIYILQLISNSQRNTQRILKIVR